MKNSVTYLNTSKLPNQHLLYLLLVVLAVTTIVTPSFSSKLNGTDSITVNDSSKIKVDAKKDFTIKEHLRLLRVNYQLQPSASSNYNRFKVVSDHTDNIEQYKFNSAIQRYLKDSDITYQGSIQNQVDHLGIKTDFEYGLGNKTNKDIYHSVLRSNIVNISHEDQLDKLITSSTKEMMASGNDNLATDLLPFITMLMNEQHEYNYDGNRAISTKPSAKGIVTTVQMLNTMATLDNDNKLGVCRDTHDMGLRVLRNMYRVYLDERYPGNNYNVDDYIFLQAWVTPSSQHVTLVVADPENPRDFHELDWGRVIEKKDQEGVEIGKMVGTAVRLWQYDEQKDITVAFNLIRSSWGSFFDKELLTDDEQWFVNGIYTPQYSSGANYRFNIGEKERTNVSVSAGQMNAFERYLSGTIRSAPHTLQLTKFMKYEAFASWQSMYIDDTERKSETMTWIEWNNASNLITSIRYISDLKTKDFEILPNLTFGLFAKSQIEAFLTMSYFNSNHEDFGQRLYKSGDGNVWTTWGGQLNYQNQSKKLSTTLNYSDRNFLIPSEVRLLSPNPIVLFENATSVKSGRGIQSKTIYKLRSGVLQFDIRFENDAMKSDFLYGSVAYNISTKNKMQFFSKTGFFKQVDGIEYYWYTKNRVWLTTGIVLPKYKTHLSLTLENIDQNDFSFGTSISKSF